jgi:hypothetical protein
LNWENATYVSHRNGLKMGVPPQRARRLSRATSTLQRRLWQPGSEFGDVQANLQISYIQQTTNLSGFLAYINTTPKFHIRPHTASLAMLHVMEHYG